MVQDFDSVIATAPALEDDLASRVEFMSHDFFTEQPVRDADVYFFRWIFHNWSDKYCIKILESLIPAFKTGARIIISDAVVPQANQMPKRMERQVRSFDLVMSAIHNGKERELSDWAELFQAADKRFEFQETIQPPGSNHSLIVAVWTG